MSPREAKFRLRDIADAIANIQSYTQSGRDNFLGTPVVQDAVFWKLAVIGEAVKDLPPDLVDRVSSVDWAAMAGMRDFLIHHYFAADLDTVWETIVRDLPELDQRVRDLLEDSLGA